MNLIKKYGLPFLIGGLTVSGIKYSSHHMKQEYAAIIGALPLGLFSTLFVIELNKTDDYIKNYTLQTVLTILAGAIYLFCSQVYVKFVDKSKSNDISPNRVRFAYIISITTWILLSILKLGLI
jgi:hypothetical protein